jgi:hypothetical protein
MVILKKYISNYTVQLVGYLSEMYFKFSPLYAYSKSNGINAGIQCLEVCTGSNRKYFAPDLHRF